IEAIYRSTLRLHDGETTIFVLSDMREVNETFNFERRPPSESAFLNWITANDIKPVFKGPTKIIVCGLHPYAPGNTSPMTIRNYDRLLKLWQAVFKKWGVRATISENYDFNDD
ncbi:MAG: hypothetical protein ACYDFU_10010, partial [Nitrospirota bacterium]